MRNYFKHLEHASIVEFIVVLAIIAFVIKIPAGILGSVFVGLLGSQSPLFSASLQEPTLTGEDVMLAIVFAPLIETILAQMIPLDSMRLFRLPRKARIMISAAIFMLFHFPVLEFFPSAFAVGLVLAWAWESKRNLGWSQTLVIVTLIHSLHNALVAFVAASF